MSRFLSNGLKWLARQRTQALATSIPGLGSRVRTLDLRSAFVAERESNLYYDHGISFPFSSKVFTSETTEVENNVIDKDEAETTELENNVSDKKEPEVAASPVTESKKNLTRRVVIRLVYSEPRVDNACQKWIDNGGKLTKRDVKRITRKLYSNSKFSEALQLSEWMRGCKEFEIVKGDYAMHMDLICKVHGLASAVKYFEDLPEDAKSRQTYGFLLNLYVKNRCVEKALEHWEKMKELGFDSDAYTYNDMMALYTAIGQPDKALLVMQKMKEKKVLPDSRTYNLSMHAYGAMSDIDGVEKIMDEIKAGGEHNVPWTTYSTLTKIYIKAGLVDKAESALKETEKRIPKKETGAYHHYHHYLLTHYGDLGNKEEVHRIWKSLKSVFKKPLFPNYLSVLASLVKAGDIEGAEKVFQELEASYSIINYKLSNILLDAYIKKGMLEKAEDYNSHIVEKGGTTNGRTWEILTEGYLESRQMDKAVINMKKALTNGISDGWAPKLENVMGILKHFGEQGNVEGAKEYLGLMRRFKCLTTEVYNSLLSAYLKAGEVDPNILEQMAKDNVSPDEETDRLLKLVNG